MFDKKILKFFKKSIDKAVNVCYNVITTEKERGNHQ